MTHSYSKTMAVLLLLLLIPLPSAAQGDLTKVLVGKWEGEVQMASGTYPRTLVIKSLQAPARVREVEAEYGGRGSDYGSSDSKLSPIDATLEKAGDDLVLRFRTRENWLVELTLQKDGKRLVGSVHIPAGRGGSRGSNPMQLEKVQ